MNSFNLFMSIRFVGMLLITLYIYMKIMNLSPISNYQKIVAIIFTLVMSIPFGFTPFFLFELLYITSVCIFIGIITKQKVKLLVFGVIIATGITIGIHVIVVDLIVIPLVIPLLLLITSFFSLDLSEVNFIEESILFFELFIAFLSFSFTFLLFKIKRVKKGFIFLQNEENILIGIIFCIIIMITMRVYALMDNFIGIVLLSAIIIASSIGIFHWWKSSTTAIYNQKHKDRTNDQLEHENSVLIVENEQLSKIVHRDNKLIPAMYDAVLRNLQGISTVTEKQALIDNLEKIMNERKGLVNEHQEQCFFRIRNLDNILRFMSGKALEKGVECEILITENISNMFTNYIPEGKLETVVADLMENAINATPPSGKIKVSMIESEEKVLITIWDTGVPFEIITLSELGIKKSTTNSDTGGSGIGYMTIFEILREYNLSIIIAEYSSGVFAKSISIKFDEQSKFILKSYRANELKECLSRKDVTIQSLP